MATKRSPLAGRPVARILVGPDAYVFDALARVAPTWVRATRTTW